MRFPARIEEPLQKIINHGKKNLADILYETGETAPLLTRYLRCCLYLEDLTDGILRCVLALDEPRQAMGNHVFCHSCKLYGLKLTRDTMRELVEGARALVIKTCPTLLLFLTRSICTVMMINDANFIRSKTFSINTVKI